MNDREFKPTKMRVTLDVWKCDDLKKLLSQTIKAHVKDVELAKRLEHALGDAVAYGDGGGGNIAVS